MALQIQMPTAVDPVLRSPTPAASPPSRPHSPHPSYRPSSRSERLLRDTLRKADERQLREHSVTPRRKHSDSDDLDEAAWLRNAVSRAQSASPPPLEPMPPLSRTQTSPSPIRHRGSYSLPAVPIPRPATASSPTPSSSLQRSTPLAPHEAALRTRLETVLSRVSSAPQYHFQDHKGKGHGRTRSLAGSPVAAGEWPWTVSPDSAEPPAPLTPPPTPPPSHPALSPTTPPSPFNARAASQICRQLPGYVSFQDVEGLGEPPSVDEDEEAVDEDKVKDDRKWWNWPWAGRARAQSR